jgi:hypothetical protein
MATSSLFFRFWVTLTTGKSEIGQGTKQAVPQHLLPVFMFVLMFPTQEGESAYTH